MSPLRWTCKSRAKLAAALTKQGWKVSSTKVGRLLHDLGYSLQVGAEEHARGRRIRTATRSSSTSMPRRRVSCSGRQPVISVDTKKKELVGDFKNGGKEWQPKGTPENVLVHDFPDDAVGKAIPYGVYDMARNEAWVSVGRDHDTPAFAVASIRQWWKMMGQPAYPEAKELFITADAGGSNGYRTRAWKVELQKLADELNLRIHVCHFPPGTSKWNKIEHRLFCHITENWRGKPLRTFETDRRAHRPHAARLPVCVSKPSWTSGSTQPALKSRRRRWTDWICIDMSSTVNGTINFGRAQVDHVIAISRA